MRAVFRDRQGNPLTVEEFARLAGDESYRRVAADLVGTTHVVTIWNGINPYTLDSTGALFSSMTLRYASDGVAEWGTEEWYETEEQALAGHRRRVKQARLAQRIAETAREFLDEEETP